MISRLSTHGRMQVWRFLRVSTLAAAGALVASNGHITPSVVVGVVAGAIETALRQANPAVPLSLVETYTDPKSAPPVTPPPAAPTP